MEGFDLVAPISTPGEDEWSREDEWSSGTGIRVGLHHFVVMGLGGQELLEMRPMLPISWDVLEVVDHSMHQIGYNFMGLGGPNR